MAEVNGEGASQANGHASPPSQSTSATVAAASQSQSQSQPAAASAPAHNPNVPMTSTQDNGQSKRPRDARLIHVLLSSLGVTAYQERVPLQILDFAYRHASGVLSDALHLSSDAYISQQTRAKDAPPGGLRDSDGQVSANAVQFAIASRLQYQFGGGGGGGGAGGGGLSKEFLLETAQKRNAIKLPKVLQHEWGVRLPSERFVMSGVPWGLRGEWVATEEESKDTTMDTAMGGVNQPEEQGVEAGEEGEGNMEDIFGVEGAGDEDEDMEKED
ncbi:hypothetical protein HYALB_00013777 [Hymenoscyphus albidus]|uniref:TFIID-31kDa-domain-containing protein n=1 Tax=Hymenoscyphus albidus TaxID=595503 RepID=A0A9N9Q691_9HELO|nr:hypothetical protein HYALB_00013777 [Hymenoscyphus albidus]